MRAQISRLADEHPVIISDSGGVTALMQRQLEGLGAVYTAELARGRGERDVGELSLHAAGALDIAHLPWERAYALRHAAEALLEADGARGLGAEALRSGLALARDLAAEPIVSALEARARRARVAVGAVPAPDVLSLRGGMPLTPREREVLAPVVAGRTYGEIARTLRISEKTVSTHISHLLDKTGAANRVELAGLAERSPRG